MLRRAMKAKQTGFTLIELMFTLIVLAVLLGIGVPNFRDFIRNSRLSSAANDLLADLNLARSEAVKRRVPVTLCKSTDGTSCATDNAAPFLRWIVFVDDLNSAVASTDDGNGIVNGAELVLMDRTVSATLNAPAAGRFVIYQGSGFPATAADSLTRVIFCDERGSAISVGGISAARALTVAPTGRAAVTRDKSTIDTLGGCP